MSENDTSAHNERSSETQIRENNPYNDPDIVNRKKTTLPVLESSATKLPNRDVKKIRLEREMAILTQRGTFTNGVRIRYQHYPNDKAIMINELVLIIYGDGFPFEKPVVKFVIDAAFPYICLFDLQKLDFRDFMKEDYHPSLNFAEIAQRSINFLNKNVIFINIDPTKEEDAQASKSVEVEN